VCSYIDENCFKNNHGTNVYIFSSLPYIHNQIYNSDRHQLIQQMQMIGAGAHGPQAAQTIREVAAQQGVWSLGNFGGVPPKSAIIPLCPQSSGEQTMQQGAAANSQASSSSSCAGGVAAADAMHPTKIDASEYRSVFNSCGVAMAIASMGGAFIDCNQLFCHISNYTKQEVCALTIFNLTERQDLQHAFDLICKIISPPMSSISLGVDDNGDINSNDQDADNSNVVKNIVLRGAMKDRSGVGLCVSLVKGQDGVAKCFCVTLIRNPSSPFDTSKPVPLSFEMAAAMTSATQPAAAVAAATALISKDQPDGNNNPGATRHTFTSG
jgi:PAS domain-containing protein